MNWQDSRRRAHDEGRHSRPQVDCQYCWDRGAFPDLEKVRAEQSGILPDPDPDEDPNPLDDGNPDREWMSK